MTDNSALYEQNLAELLDVIKIVKIKLMIKYGPSVKEYWSR